MIDQEDIEKIKETTEEFFQKMTIGVLRLEVGFSGDIVNLDIILEEPQILIGEKGQTLFEIQRILRSILNKKLSRSTMYRDRGSSTESGQKFFYLNLDINDYKKKKIEYLKSLAKDLADEVALTKEEKSLFPMLSYERRIIHTELSQRTDVITESRGEGQDRHIVIKPK